MSTPSVMNLRKTTQRFKSEQNKTMLDKRSKSYRHVSQMLMNNYFKKYPIAQKTPAHKEEEARMYVMQEMDKLVMQAAGSSVNQSKLNQQEKLISKHLESNMAIKSDKIKPVHLSAYPQGGLSRESSAIKSHQQLLLNNSRPKLSSQISLIFQDQKRSSLTKMMKSTNALQFPQIQAVSNGKQTMNNVTPRRVSQSNQIRSGHGTVTPQQKATMKNKLSRQVEDVPSDISLDEWGEVQKYNQEKFEFEERQRKIQDKIKQQQIKKVLDQQLKLQQDKKLMEKEQKKRIDQEVIQRARDELQQEKQQKEKIKDQVYEQKKLRDSMLAAAREKQMQDKQKIKTDERVFVMKLSKEIEQEKNDKIKKRDQERNAARAVIKDNEIHKIERIKEKEKQKILDSDAIKQEMANMEEREHKRIVEQQNREERMKAILQSMGKVERNKDKILQKQQEKEYIKTCIEKDEAAHQQDLADKLAKRRQHDEIKLFLDNQVASKKQQKSLQKVVAKDYINNLNKQEKEQDISQRQADKRRKDQLLDNQEQIKEMMAPKLKQSTSLGHMHVQKQKIGGLMSQEEARINRELLKKISDQKKSPFKDKSLDNEYRGMEKLRPLNL